MRKIAVAIAGLMLAGMAALPATQAHAQTPVPYPSALAGHPYAKDFSLTEMSSAPWNDPTNNPGNCPPNPGAISLINNSYVQINTPGQVGACASIESPHTYPTTPGYVYEADIYVSTNKNWPADWAYGDNWPNGGEIDAMEFNDELNAVSWHEAPIQNGCSQHELSTNPWTYACKDNLSHTSAPNFAAGKWTIVDYAFTSTGVDVYYDGQLYAHVPESITQNGANPMWLTFGNGSCQSNNNGQTCANSSDATTAGNLGIKYFRIFT